MEFLYTLDPVIVGMVLFTCISVLIYYPFASRERRKTMNMVERSLKMQEETNRHLQNIIQELKRSHRTLCFLADLEPEAAAMNEMQNQPSAENATNQPKLYVGNIDYAATEAELADYFARFGRIEFVNIPINRYNGRARGFGFVTFTSVQDAERAMVLDGSEFKGRQIQVNFAKERD